MGLPEMVFRGFKYGKGKYFKSKYPIAISVRCSICWYNFYANRFSGLEGVVTHIHTYIHTCTRNLVNAALSVRVTLNTKPASQVLIKYFSNLEIILLLKL